MSLKHILIYVSLIVCVSSKSFTIVVDTTMSMDDEINLIKANIGDVVNSLNRSNGITEYILVPFNDPEVGTALISRTTIDFMCSIDTITMSGGNDCPENSLAGIEHALRVSGPESTIYVFTDAYPKNYGNLPTVLDLCVNKYSQVIVLLTGMCLMSPRNSAGRLDLFSEVARVCGGAVLQFDSAQNLREAFSYIKELNRHDWNEVLVHDNIRGQRQINFILNQYSKNAMVVVYGGSVQLHIQDEAGLIVTLNRIIDTSNVQVFRIEPKHGKYFMSIRTHDTVTVTIYIKSDLIFCFGFSPKYPKTLQETAERPLPGRSNYILISVVDTKVRLVSLEMKCGNMTSVLQFEYTANDKYYTSRTFIDRDKLCRINAKGEDENSQKIMDTTKLIKPQEKVTNIAEMKPQAMIIHPEYNLYDFGSDVNLACKVKGFPEPVVKWEDIEGNPYHSETTLLEMPSTFISYVTISNITSNVTIYCKAQNTEGESGSNIEIYVNRTYFFDILEAPEDRTIEYGQEGTIYCKVSAYPEVRVKWYHNNTELFPTDDVQLRLDALVIQNMDLEYTGDYKCMVENEIERREFNFEINISGLEAPQIETDTQELVLKLGESAELECRVVKGKPVPHIMWEYKSETDFDFDLPNENVTFVGDKLKIVSAQICHKGIYRCTASNFMGESSVDMAVKVQFAPIIIGDEYQTILVKKGEEVSLTCHVKASPEAIVRWEMCQDDVIIAMDHRHVIDKYNTHSFTALRIDSGQYHCIAENALGSAKKTVLVNVSEAPYIEAPESEMVTVRLGATVKLACNVLSGNPAPTLIWKFMAKNLSSKVIRLNRTSSLTLTNVSKSNEGLYMCIVENTLGSDRIKYHLQVE